jgi:hypothetical protein
MPNHVTEVVFRGVSLVHQEDILALVRGREADIDFETLLPIPLNVWQGSVGTRHSVFPDNALDWCRANWNTKWNAYGLDQGGKYRSIDQADDTLTLTFQTAWSTPYGWLLALWHRSGRPFEYTWLDEGRSNAFAGRFTAYSDDFSSEPWTEAEADEETTRRMHKLMWGVEEFPAEEGGAA